MGTGLAAIRTVIGASLLALACWAPAHAQDRELRSVIQDQEPRLRSPLAEDIERQLRDAARGIEHDLSLEQSRVDARSTSALQRRQTQRDVQLSGQRLNTLKTTAPQQRSIPLLERKLDRVSRPTGTLSRDPGLETGGATSLGLSGRLGR
jgi:hypothetical protein